MKASAAIPYLRKALKLAVAAAMLAAVTAAFFGVRECAVAARIQAVPALMALDAAAIAVLLVLAIVWGRLYCEIVCPLGIAQDLVRFISRKKVRRVCSRLPEGGKQKIVKWTVFAVSIAVWAAGMSFVWLDPYAIFGRGLSLAGALFSAVLALALAGRGRFWCNWICPVGTLLQAISRFSVVKDKVSKHDHCEECRKCLEK